MSVLMETAQYIGIFLLGLLLRAAIVLAVIAMFVVVLAPLLYGYAGGRLLLCRAAGLRWFHGLQWRRSLRYTPGHLWLRERNEILRVGLDDLAAHLLRRAARVVLPPPGTHLREGQPLATFDAGGRQVVLPAPFGGTVSAINDSVLEDPALSARHPYGRGWLLEFAPGDDRFAALPRRAASRRWFDGEASRFACAIGEANGIAMADGGELVTPGDPALAPLEFARLAQEFLQADVAPAAAEMPHEVCKQNVAR